MRRFFTYSLLCFSLFALSSCLTFEETYTFKKNGSGTARYVIDMSEMSALLNMAQESEDASLDEINDMAFSKSIPTLEQIPGISKIKSLDDPDAYLYGISFSFKSVDVLNQALNILMNEEGNESHTFFTKEGNVIKRTHRLAAALDPSELLGDEDEEASAYASSLLESITYKVNLSFKKSVKVVYSGAEAQILGKKNRVVNIKTNLKTLSEDIEALNAAIVLK